MLSSSLWFFWYMFWIIQEAFYLSTPDCFCGSHSSSNLHGSVMAFFGESFQWTVLWFQVCCGNPYFVNSYVYYVVYLPKNTSPLLFITNWAYIVKVTVLMFNSKYFLFAPEERYLRLFLVSSNDVKSCSDRLCAIDRSKWPSKGLMSGEYRKWVELPNWVFPIDFDQRHNSWTSRRIILTSLGRFSSSTRLSFINSVRQTHPVMVAFGLSN